MEEESLADLNFLRWADESGPVVVAFGRWDRVGEENFDLACGFGRVVLRVQAGAGAEKTRGENAGVVQDEQIAGAEDAGEVGEVSVFVGAGGAIKVEHAAGAADVGRLLGDEVFGEIVVEVGDEHAC